MTFFEPHGESDVIADVVKRRQIGSAGGMRVWTVDGEKLREFDEDFALTGNLARYTYVPSDEIWLEETTVAPVSTAILHELAECRVMEKFGYDYEHAHDIANVFEKMLRDSIELGETAVRSLSHACEIADREFAASSREIDTFVSHGDVRKFVEEISRQPKLSARQIAALIERFGAKNKFLGRLTWKYKDLGGSRTGLYDHSLRRLFVDPTPNATIEKQTETVLHEIRHWNQHVRVAELVIERLSETDPTQLRDAEEHVGVKEKLLQKIWNVFEQKYSATSEDNYAANPFETDAREFAKKNLKIALESVN